LKQWRLGLIAALLVWPPLGLAAAEQQLTLGSQVFQFSVADDPETRRQGLMGRELAPQTGMLFDFPQGTRPAIWMHNMQISLDLLFVDAEGRIQHLFAEVPPCRQTPCNIYQASEPLRYVLEVPAGTAQALGLKQGDQLDMSRLPSSPPAN
jgi:uncharacterized protein